MRCLEKKIWVKNFDFEQIATWVKANLGLCLWIPIVIPKRTLYGPNKDYNRDLIRIVMGMQRHHAEVCLHPSRDLLKINIFHPDFFLDTVWCSWSIKKEQNRQNNSQTSQNIFLWMQVLFHAGSCPALCRWPHIAEDNTRDFHTQSKKCIHFRIEPLTQPFQNIYRYINYLN